MHALRPEEERVAPQQVDAADSFGLRSVGTCMLVQRHELGGCRRIDGSLESAQCTLLKPLVA